MLANAVLRFKNQFIDFGHFPKKNAKIENITFFKKKIYNTCSASGPVQIQPLVQFDNTNSALINGVNLNANQIGNGQRNGAQIDL